MKTLEWTTILGGVIAAVIAAFILDWLNRGTSRVGASAAQNAWRNTLTQPDPPFFASGQYIGGQNSNSGLYDPCYTGPISASAYNDGAPTPTYRPDLRIGTVLVAAQ